MARNSTLRASDADRDAVAERLRTAAIEGRLEAHELEERIGLALRARTYGDLERLLVDLPSGRPRPRPRPQVPVARTIALLAFRLLAVLVILALVGIALAVSAAWLLIWAVVWLALRGGHGCSGHRRVHRRTAGVAAVRRY